MKWKNLNFAREPIPPGALEKPKANTKSAGSNTNVILHSQVKLFRFSRMP